MTVTERGTTLRRELETLNVLNWQRELARFNVLCETNRYQIFIISISPFLCMLPPKVTPDT